MVREHDVEKLPRWAREKIAGLEGELARVKEQFANLSEPGITNTYHNIYGPVWTNTPHLYLPNYTRVTFTLKNGGYFTVGIDKRSEKLEIIAISHIIIEAGNSCSISLSV